MKKMSPAAPLKGFTLIELMVTVAIIGILAAIAYPSYVQYVKRANRAEVRGILLENAQLLERNFTMANRYDTVNQDGSGGAPPIIIQSPRTGVKKYDITPTYGTAPAQTFRLDAVPTGAMSGDVCGTYTLDNTGQQGQGSGGTAALCWGK